MIRSLAFMFAATAGFAPLHANPDAAKAAPAQTAHHGDAHHGHHGKAHGKHHMSREDMAKICQDEISKAEGGLAGITDAEKKAEAELHLEIAKAELKAINNPAITKMGRHKAACLNHAKKAMGSHHHGAAHHGGHHGAAHHQADHHGGHQAAAAPAK